MSKKISELPQVSSLSKAAIVPLVQSSTTYKASLETLNELIKFDAGLNHEKGISGNLVTSGNARISGDLTVSGNATLGLYATHSIITKGRLTHSGVSVFSGDASFSGQINSTGNVKLGRNASSSIDLSGRVRVGGELHNFGNFYITGTGFSSRDFYVNNSGSFGNPLSTQTHVFYGRTTVSGDAYLNDRLVVASTITGNAGLSIGTDAVINGNLNITGNTRIGESSSYALDIYSSTTVNGPFVCNSEVHFGDKINVANNASFSGHVYLGNSNADSTVIAGPATFSSVLMAQNGLNITGTSRFSGEAKVDGNMYCSTGLVVGGHAHFTGEVDLGKQVNNKVSIRGTGYIGKDLYITGDLYVSGNVKFARGYEDLKIVKGFFNPQVRYGIKTTSLNTSFLRYESGLNPGGLSTCLFVWNDGSNIVEWDTNDIQAGDFVFLSGYRSDTSSSLNTGYLPAYNGIFKVVQTLTSGFRFYPTGHPISPNYVGDGYIPAILAHWRPSWIGSGVNSIVCHQGAPHFDTYGGSNNGANLLHHTIKFNTSFSNSDYLAFLTVNQGTGKHTDTDTTRRMKVANVSYLDKNINSEKTIMVYLANDESTNINEDQRFNATPSPEKVYQYHMPTRVYFRFENV